MDNNDIWLPPLVLMGDFQGDWKRYLQAVYQYFCEDFVVSRPCFENKRFGLKKHPVIEGKEATFWHIISAGEKENERLPDLRRCERIRWPGAIIKAINSGYVKSWKSSRKGEERIAIALQDFSYIVILADRGDYVLLWTAFCVELEHRRKKLRREYEESLCQNG
ncbi:MAG TPA: hypothetical protein VGF67_07290 [Ktedonobacteraceae bacterium]|jgi:hypothetical protein